MIWDY